MKISKTGWIIITIGVFMIALIGLGAVRSQQVNQQIPLDEELTSAELNLDRVQIEQRSQRQEELEQQLTQNKSQSETARAALSQSIESIVISGILFDIAEHNNVEVTEISSSGLATAELDGLTCLVLPLTASVSGNVTDLVSFITKLNAELATGITKSVEIIVPEMTGELASANIQLVIYGYQGE